MSLRQSLETTFDWVVAINADQLVLGMLGQNIQSIGSWKTVEICDSSHGRFWIPKLLPYIGQYRSIFDIKQIDLLLIFIHI
jgi:hypothetical protein